MTKLNIASQIITFLASLSALCLVIFLTSKEYNKRQIHICEISHDASTTTLPCEYVDGIVKIKL